MPSSVTSQSSVALDASTSRPSTSKLAVAEQRQRVLAIDLRAHGSDHPPRRRSSVSGGGRSAAGRVALRVERAGRRAGRAGGRRRPPAAPAWRSSGRRRRLAAPAQQVRAPRSSRRRARPRGVLASARSASPACASMTTVDVVVVPGQAPACRPGTPPRPVRPAARRRRAAAGAAPGSATRRPAAATSSSSSSSCSASAETCSFSSATLVTRPPPLACRKNVGRRAGPPCPATNRSGGSKAAPDGSLPSSSRLCGTGTAAGCAPGAASSPTAGTPWERPPQAVLAPRRRCVRSSAERPGRSDRGSPVSFIRSTNGRARGVADHGHRARVDLDPLEGVQVHPERVGEDRLDHVAVAAPPPRSRRRRARRRSCRPDCGPPRPRGAASPRSDSPPGTRRARVRLHDLPQRVLGQRLERLPLPVAVPALPKPLVRARLGERRAGAASAAAVSGSVPAGC